MYRLLVSAFVAAACLLTASAAPGQWFGGFANQGYHASTVAEGEGNAISAVTRSKGQFLIDKSQARINNAQADAMVMQNRKQLAQDYFETQALNKEKRFSDYDERRKRHTQESLFKYGEEGRPTRLTSSELDPVTGHITWPIMLEGPTFTQYTGPIDRAFLKRAKSKSRFNYETYQKATKDCKGLETELRTQMTKIGTQDYATGIEFVKRLKREVRNAAS